MLAEGVDNLHVLERALQQTSRVIAAISPEQGALPTPCSEWDVRTLVRHVAAQDLRNFTLRARGETADWQAPPDEVGDDWTAQFEDGAARLLETWRSADLDRMVSLPGGHEATLRSIANQQIAELAVHSWDLARATGQDAELDDSVAEHGLQWARGMLRPEFRGPDKAFAVEVPVPEDAPVYERLAGWFGRDPRWPEAQSRG